MDDWTAELQDIAISVAMMFAMMMLIWLLLGINDFRRRYDRACLGENWPSDADRCRLRPAPIRDGVPD